MHENYEPRISVEQITDAEIAMAIRYLDPDRSGATSSAKREAVFVMCFFLLALIAGIQAYIWLYFRVH
jgi:hypothetical protein